MRHFCFCQFVIIIVLVVLLAIFSVWSMFRIQVTIPVNNASMVNYTCRIAEMYDPIGWVSNVVRLGYKRRIDCNDETKAANPPVAVRYVQWNDTAEHLLKLTGFEHADCEFAQVHYDGDGDIKTSDTWRELNESRPVLRTDLLPPQYDQYWDATAFVKVRCSVNGSQIYEDIHMFMPELDRFKAASVSLPKKPKVLILCIDSLTRINFVRSMPKTVTALEALGNVFYLKGFTRMEDNTFPNMLAFLTGRKESDFEGNARQIPLEQLPHIWKLYESRGLLTAMVDDNPPIAKSMLSYGSEGFHRPPTTFYPQPFWTYWKEREGSHVDDRNCLDNARPVPKLMLDQMVRFLTHCERHQVGYFAMSMLIRTTHNGWSDAEKLDVFYESFFREHAQLLNDTVVVIMGDHGDRYSEEMTYTSWGQIESMLPLMVIRLPPSLLKSHPSMAHMLRSNEKRLTDMLDMHKTLVELARLGEKPWQYENETEVYTDSAYSVISEQVPMSRTCADARIESEYCVCDMKPFTEMDNSSMVQELAIDLVEQLNSMLPQDKCQRLQLVKVESAVWHRNSYWIEEVLDRMDIELTVRLAPSNAVLRTRVSRSAVTSWNKVTKQYPIQRLNQYGNQSHCLQDVNLKKYCLCHDISVPLVNSAPLHDFTDGRLNHSNVTAFPTDGATSQMQKNSSSLPSDRN